jgi:hypothetical protein
MFVFRKYIKDCVRNSNILMKKNTIMKKIFVQKLTILYLKCGIWMITITNRTYLLVQVGLNILKLVKTNHPLRIGAI